MFAGEFNDAQGQFRQGRGTAGDRTVSRYRALARSRLGAMCPTGIFAPEQGEVDATLADWLNEIERVQLMLRLTPRLRQKYQD